VRSGVFAALLARAGLAYPLTIFEGEYGFAKMVTASFDETILRSARAISKFSRAASSCGPAWAPPRRRSPLPWRSRSGNPAWMKSRPSCRAERFRLRQQAAYPEEISTREHADHSIPYLVARALLDGDVKVTDFEVARFKDRARWRSSENWRSVRSRALEREPGANVEVTLRGGTVLRRTWPIPPGNMLNPASDADLTRKFLVLSENVLGRARAQKAIEAILAVDAMPNLGILLDALAPA